MSSNVEYHPGERAVQQRAGETAIADLNGAVMASTILAGARPFIGKQSMAVLASVDGHGAAWSSVLYGQPGFVHADVPSVVTFDVPSARRAASDPFWNNICSRRDIGMLFIELGSRRRYRINGAVTRLDGRGFEVTVREAYPNCPRFIQRRLLKSVLEDSGQDGVATGAAIAGGVATLIRAADTLFLASYNPETGADASHRGGNPGFIQLVGERTLRVPDYAGNSLFNTFGNVELNGLLGLCIPDFAHGRLLQLTGEARLMWDQPDPEGLTDGTGRFWEFQVASWVLRQVPQRLEWEYLDASPFNPPVTKSVAKD